MIIILMKQEYIWMRLMIGQQQDIEMMDLLELLHMNFLYGGTMTLLIEKQLGINKKVP